MFALVDCNNFYASCERVFRPELNGQPVVVLSNNDGCVIARSNEAKSFGIPMGAVAFQYRKQFEEHNIHVFSSNYALYGDMSQRVMNILGQFTPEVEVYSIDEAFLKFNGFEHYDLQAYGVEMRKRVQKWTGIPISVGFAPTKALSKVANKIAKKFPEKTNGSHVIDSEEKRIKALKWTKIEDVWGIGHQHAKRLKALNVHTAYDFTQLPDEWVRKQMSVVGLRLKHELEGKPCLDMELPQTKKNIATTRSFEKALYTFEELRERITTFSVICSEKLRKQGSCCHSLVVMLKTNKYREGVTRYYYHRVMMLPYASNSALTLTKFAVQGLQELFQEGLEYKKAGIIVGDLIPENQRQFHLFEDEDPRHLPLMRAIDATNKKLGQTKIRMAGQDPKRTWKMRQEHLSPRYTTHLNDVITVSCP
ncbi:MAG: Y-family DNA polymerase [Flavobacterium sp.]